VSKIIVILSNIIARDYLLESMR